MSDQSHITLRKLEPDDLPLLYEWENDAAAWLDGDTHNPLSKADLRDYIMRTTGDIYKDGQLRLMICLSDENESNEAEQGREEPVKTTAPQPVGCIDLYNVDIRNRKAAVAIYLSPVWRKRRLGTRALLQLKTYVANILCFRFLYALVKTDNIPSLKLFQSVGFHTVACLPKWVNEGDIFVLQSPL